MSSYSQMPSSTKPKMAATKNVPLSATEAKTASKMHRRSRSGCFTCRLRRKKCEESKPACKACTNLGLRCDYKRPMWWSNGEQRRQQKENIKNIIKQTQLTKKAQQVQQSQSGMTSPPGLCHSVPSATTTNTTDLFPDSLQHSRQGSVDSAYSQPAEFPQYPIDGFFHMPGNPHQMVAQAPFFAPYEMDVKTERAVFVNDVQMRKDSTISTFSSYHPPLQSAFPTESWVQQEFHESFNETFPEEPLDFNFFDFQHGQMTPNHETVIEVEDCDKYLLNHFLDRVMKLIFPVLDANQHGSVRTDVVVPALESNKAYLHCCLSIAATHMKATQGLEGEQIDNDIIRHRYAAITELCEALDDQSSDRGRILEATLGMIFFQCSVGRSKDALPDIPWHQHFQAATDLVDTLQLPQVLINMAKDKTGRPPFNMTLTAWIDILGATMVGRAPAYADAYRELNNTPGATAGLAELMGCDDSIMFLISEIACLDAAKATGLSDELLFQYVSRLGRAIEKIEPNDADVQNCFSSTGAIRPKQLQTNLTAVFASAARIYLLSLMPDHHPGSQSGQYVISKFVWQMNYIPEGPEGFDRCLAWPLLMAGANASPTSPFRNMFASRCSKLNGAEEFGSLGRVRELLHDIWAIQDSTPIGEELRSVHWRDVMQSKNWDSLLI